MNRIDRIFHALRQADRKALMPYVTAGDPDAATTAQLLPALASAGASICELGLAFSDPVADGPVIQASMTHALNQGITVERVFEAVAQVRPDVDLGLVAMVSYSMVYRMGLTRFVAQAKAAGFDGFIFPDLPVEESAPAVDAVRSQGLVLSQLISPTTSPGRAEQIAAACSGFVYVLSRSGITGEQTQLPAELPQRLTQLRQVTDLPLAVGFGISSAPQVRQVVEVADAAIVGSAVVKQIASHRPQGPAAVVKAVQSCVCELASGLRRESSTPGG